MSGAGLHHRRSLFLNDPSHIITSYRVQSLSRYEAAERQGEGVAQRKA